MIMAGKVTNPSRVPRNAILLSKVSSLTLRNGKQTSSRRVDPAPQLQCVGPEEICRLYNVDMMRCVNEGADYDAENIQWSCKASMPDDFKLGSTDVVCEGYESSDDPYVLKGSCGVEYRLLLTDKGDQKYGSLLQEHERPSASISTDFTKVPGLLFFLIFSVVVFIILRGIWSAWNGDSPRPRGTRPNGGGGGGGNDDDPPPPYDESPPSYSPPRKSKTQTTAPRNSTASSSTRASSSRSAPRAAQEQGWRPGFWTGTAAGATVAGAAANYFSNSRNQSTRREPPQPETQQRSGGFFSNLGAPQERPQTSPPSSSSNTTPNYSTTRHESTGFGSTRRR